MADRILQIMPLATPLWGVFSIYFPVGTWPTDTDPVYVIEPALGLALVEGTDHGTNYQEIRPIFQVDIDTLGTTDSPFALVNSKALSADAIQEYRELALSEQRARHARHPTLPTVEEVRQMTTHGKEVH